MGNEAKKKAYDTDIRSMRWSLILLLEHRKSKSAMNEGNASGRPKLSVDERVGV